MALALVVQDLWRDVVWRATNRLLAFFGVFQQRCQAKVANLYLHVLVQEEVAQLQVAVNDRVVVHVLDPREDLHHVVARLGLQVGSAALDNVVHILG